MGYTTARVLKTRWATGPIPLRHAGYRPPLAGMCHHGRVANIRIVEPHEAHGPLKDEYDAAVERAGKVFNIVKSMSLQPHVLAESMRLYRAIMHGPSTLSRQERELLATVVSAAHECYY